MKTNKSVKNSILSWMGMFSICLVLGFTSCEPGPGRMDTESNQNFEGEENLPVTEPTDANANPAEVRADSTPGADNPDLDNNPVIDKGVSSDSAFNNTDQNKQ
jgi:hypothetical protein